MNSIKAKEPTNGTKPSEGKVALPLPTCGIVIPISAIDDCSEAHWGDVLTIVSDAISDAGFYPNIVSNADESGIIQKRIIQNLFENPIVVCDVSGKNPNVMFELGMRLAFDKPTIVIKDDKTDYSFDTSPIEHVGYPRDLRFSRIVEFKAKLTEKIIATYKISQENASYTTFLKHFGEFKVAELEQKTVGLDEYILDELKELRLSMRRIQFDAKRDVRNIRYDGESEIDICLDGFSLERARELLSKIQDTPYAKEPRLRELGGHSHLICDIGHLSDSGRTVARRRIRDVVRQAQETNLNIPD